MSLSARLTTAVVTIAALACGTVIAQAAETSAPPGFVPGNASWLGAGEGYVFGEAPCNQPTLCDTLLRTADGAKSWTRIPVPEFDLPDNQYRSDPVVVAASPTRVMVYDLNRVMETTDAGKTWTQLAFNAASPSLTIGTARYFHGKVYAVAGGPEQVDLYASGQGAELQPVPGVTMHRSFTDVQANLAGGDALQVSLTNIAQQWPASTWRSTDGKTFTQQPYPCLAGETPIYAEHARNAPIAALCESTEPNGPGNWDKAMVLAPSTGGKVTRTPPAPRIGVVAGFAMVTDKLAVMPLTGGGVTFVLRTEDAGLTWTNTFTIDGQVWSPDLTFVNHTTAYLTNRTGLFRSTDTGRTWQQVTFG